MPLANRAEDKNSLRNWGSQINVHPDMRYLQNVLSVQDV